MSFPTFYFFIKFNINLKLKNMSRYSFKTKDFEITYGYDRPLSGYFLTIYCSSCAYNSENTKAQNNIAELIDSSGEGIVKDFSTSKYLTGITIVHQDLAIILAKLGCENEEHIAAMCNYEEF